MNIDCNGRINIAGDNTMKRFELYDKIPINERENENFNSSALTGNWENSILSNAFFSGENISIIQNAIRAGVHAKTNGRYLISNQDIDTIKIIMRAIYLQHCKNLPTNITEQIQELNTISWLKKTKNVMKQISQWYRLYVLVTIIDYQYYQ